MISNRRAVSAAMLALAVCASALLAQYRRFPKQLHTDGLKIDGVSCRSSVDEVCQKWGPPDRRRVTPERAVLDWDNGRLCYADKSNRIFMLVGNTVESANATVAAKGDSQAWVRDKLGPPASIKLGGRWFYYNLKDGSRLAIEFVEYKVFEMRLTTTYE